MNDVIKATFFLRYHITLLYAETKCNKLISCCIKWIIRYVDRWNDVFWVTNRLNYKNCSITYSSSILVLWSHSCSTSFEGWVLQPSPLIFCIKRHICLLPMNNVAMRPLYTYVCYQWIAMRPLFSLLPNKYHPFSYDVTVAKIYFCLKTVATCRFHKPTYKYRSYQIS